ncbi:hypothetical protein ACJX0J_027005 [Zea mays]
MILLICTYNNFYIAYLIYHFYYIHLVGVYFVFHLVGVYFVFTAFHLPVLEMGIGDIPIILYLFELCFIPRIMEGVLSTMLTLQPHFLMQIVLSIIWNGTIFFIFLYKDLSHMYVDGLNKMMPSTLWLVTNVEVTNVEVQVPTTEEG